VNGFGGSMVWRHLDGTECRHRIVRDSEAPNGCYCAVTHSDVLLDDGGPSTGRITVVLNNDEGRFTPDKPLRPVFPQTPPPPSRYLDGPAGRSRHRADTPGMFSTWPEALAHIGMWAVFSGIIVGVPVGIVWGALYLLS